MNEAEEAKCLLEVLFILCDVCQGEKETVEKSLLLTTHCIIIIFACILQTWKDEADVHEKTSLVIHVEQRHSHFQPSAVYFSVQASEDVTKQIPIF